MCFTRGGNKKVGKLIKLRNNKVYPYPSPKINVLEKKTHKTDEKKTQ